MELLKTIFDQAILPSVITAVAGAVAILASYATYQMSEFFKEMKIRGIVEDVVLYVEQKSHELSGPEKYAETKALILAQAEAKGLAITDSQLDLLVESFIGGMNAGWNKTIPITAKLSDGIVVEAEITSADAVTNEALSDSE